MEEEESIKLIKDYLSSTKYEKKSFQNFIEVNHEAILNLELMTPCELPGLKSKWRRRWLLQENIDRKVKMIFD